MKFRLFICFSSFLLMYCSFGLCATAASSIEGEKLPVSVRPILRIPEYSVWLEREVGHPAAASNPLGPKKTFEEFYFKVMADDKISEEGGGYQGKIGYLWSQWLPDASQSYPGLNASVLRIRSIGIGPDLSIPGLMVDDYKSNPLQKNGYGTMALETFLISIKHTFPKGTFIYLEAPRYNHLQKWYEGFGFRPTNTPGELLAHGVTNMRLCMDEAKFPRHKTIKGKKKEK